MKTKYTSKLLIGAATLSLATFISQGNADASEKTSSLADAQPATFESANVSDDQKAFYQVLHLDGISESQRDQYIKQLHEDPKSAQNVFSESIKDATNPERRVAQQNAFYGLLHNEDLSDEQRDAYIKEIKEDPDQSQDVFVKSLNSTPEAEQQPQAPKNDILEKEDKSIYEANDALKALQKEDTIQNRRTAQRAVNKLPKHKVDAFQEELDRINAPRDAKIKADAEAKQQELQIGKSPEVEKTPVPIEDPKAENEKKPEAKVENETKEAPKAEKTPKVEDKKQSEKATDSKQAKPEAEKAPKVQVPKVENKTETDKTTDTKKAEEVKPSTEATPEVKNNTESNTVVPVLPETGEATTSTLSSYWNSFKNSVTSGYNYVKDGVTKGYKYLKDQYDYVSQRYNDAKYYVDTYRKYKKAIDISVLGLFNKNGTGAHIAPLEIGKDDNLLYKSYANTRNFVTEGINTGKVLYTLYEKPEVVKTAITAIDAANKVKGFFNNIFSFFK